MRLASAWGSGRGSRPMPDIVPPRGGIASASLLARRDDAVVLRCAAHRPGGSAFARTALSLVRVPGARPGSLLVVHASAVRPGRPLISSAKAQSPVRRTTPATTTAACSARPAWHWPPDVLSSPCRLAKACRAACVQSRVPGGCLPACRTRRRPCAHHRKLRRRPRPAHGTPCRCYRAV